MALKGTLGDFALTDILQLIGLQRKSGLLVIRHGDDEVSVGFEAGKVVSAESKERPAELKVGQLLVRSGKITEQRLSEALEIQKKTLQRLGHVLLRHGWIEKEALSRELQLQMTETVYDLFRWRDGEYDFRPDEKVEWERDFVTPVPSETLLMEGAQMVDEWPIIERVIPGRSVILRPTAHGGQVLATTSDVKEARGSVYDDDFDFGFLPENPLEEKTESQRPEYSELEISVLRWVDGRRSAGEIAEMTGLGSFETFKTLARLVELHLVFVDEGDAVVARRGTPALFTSAWPARVFGVFVGLLAGVGGLASLGELGLALDPRAPRPNVRATLAPSDSIEALLALDRGRASSSSARLARLERAIRSYVMQAGQWPSDLGQVVDLGILAERELLDPWGEAYLYEPSREGFRLLEASPRDGRRPLERTYSFTAFETQLGY